MKHSQPTFPDEAQARVRASIPTGSYHAAPFDRWPDCQCFRCRDQAATTYQLDAAEDALAAQVAKDRRSHARRDGRKARGDIDNASRGLLFDLMGATAEIAVAHLLGVPPELSTEPDTHEGDLRGCSIKARSDYGDGTWFCVTTDHPKRQPVIFVTVVGTLVHVVGWNWATEIQRRVPVGRPEPWMDKDAHWVRADAQRPILRPWHELVFGLEMSKIIPRRNYRVQP